MHACKFICLVTLFITTHIATAQDVAYFDLQRIKLPEAIKSQVDRLVSNINETQEELPFIWKSYEEKEKDLNKKLLLLRSDVARQRQDELLQLRRELVEKQADMMQEMEKLNKRALSIRQNAIKEAVQAVAREQGYKMLLEKRDLLYEKDGIDVSALVNAKLLRQAGE